MSMAEYERLYAMATTMSDARDQVAVFEELLRLSDSNGDVEVSFKVRMEMVSLCNEGGYPEKAIVAFTWCLAEFDKNPELGSLYNLIWTYKVILEYIPIFSTISKDQIVSIQEDMAKRLLTYGETERTAHYYRSWNWMRMGDYETALEYQQRYVSMKRSTVSDCNACELDRRIELFSRMARDEECLTMAEPVIAGRSRCGEVPEFTNAHIARCLLRQDKISKAIKLEASGYPLVARQRKYLGTIGDLMLVLVRAGDFDTLVSRIVRHLGWCVDSVSDELKFRFFNSCGLGLQALSSTNVEPLKVLLPETIGCFREDGIYEVDVLAAWFTLESQRIAERFDKRNGNRSFRDRMEEDKKLCQF